ncbi:MAG: helix-turn-helix domain-containing protein [Micromonosporaceae bacterium]|nr:helix-turn-helix domain-containing protein [Micromonosporaceae bacterium]
MTRSVDPAPVPNPAAQRLATRLRRLRETRGLPRRELAGLFAVSISLIEKVERAERAPDPSLITKYEQTFAEARGLRELWADMAAERQAGQERLAVERHNRQPVAAQVGARSRRRLPQRIAADPATVLGTADGIRLSMEVLLDDGPHGQGWLERLLDQTEQYARDALTVAPADMLDRLLLAMNDARHLGTTGRVDPRRLRGVIARLAVLAAEEVTLLGQMAAARAWYATAVAAADASTSDRLRADIRALSSLLPLRSGHPGEAVRIAEQAMHLAGPRLSLTCAIAPAARAVGLAQLGQDRAARSSLALAQDGARRLEEPLRAESLLAVAPRRLLLWEGQMRTGLGDFEAAWRAHRKALADYPPEAVADRITICLDRATGLIGSGQIADGAELVATTIINIPVDHRSPWYLSAARSVLASIPPRARQLVAVTACQRLLNELDTDMPATRPTKTNRLIDATVDVKPATY